MEETELIKKELGGRRATCMSVARLAGVHKGSVSRALSGNAPVSEAVRKKVFEAARALNYRPSSAAQILTGRSKETSRESAT